MLEATLPTLSSNLAAWHSGGGALPPRTGNRHSTLMEAPCNVYPTKDGYIALICYAEDHWHGMCRLMNRPDLASDPRFCDRVARATNMDELDRVVATWTSSCTKAEASAQLTRHNVINAPVRSLEEVVHDEHLLERGSLRWEKHQGLGDIVIADSPIRFPEAKSVDFVTSPMVGQHNEQIICGMLGHTKSELWALQDEGAI
jgi:formyl-CoA transferase